MNKSIRKIFYIFFIIMITNIFIVGCGSKEKKDNNIIISAASSLQDPIKEIINKFEKENNIKVDLNLASSGKLEKQIERGAPADLFMSADPLNVKRLIDKGLIDENSYENFLSNDIVLIANNKVTKINSLDNLKNKEVSIVIGETTTVPVGIYGKESLQNLKIWDTIKDKIIFAANVKQVLNYVEKGEAEVGIIYESDSLDLKNSHVVTKIPSNTHKDIFYGLGFIKSSSKKDKVDKFIKYIKNNKSKEIFSKYKFKVLK